MIDFLITIMRLPVAVIDTGIVIISCLVVLPLETMAVLVSFPFAALFMRRDTIKSWLRNYPRSLLVLKNMIKNIWDWATGSDSYLHLDIWVAMKNFLKASLFGFLGGSATALVDIYSFHGPGSVGWGIGCVITIGIFGLLVYNEIHDIRRFM
jgi:hypothetical protein